MCARVCACVCVLPEQTYADPAALSESTETKPLFAVDVRQHEGEILPHLILGNPEAKGETRNLLTINSMQRGVVNLQSHTHLKFKREKKKQLVWLDEK